MPEYPTGWTPHDPPDELDALAADAWTDETFRSLWAQAMQTEAGKEPAPGRCRVMTEKTPYRDGRCAQELCANWSGDGRVCPCVQLDIEGDDRPITQEDEQW